MVALRRPLAAVILFAANGPHTRTLYIRDIDSADIEAQKILINGFIGYLKNLLDRLDDLKQKGLKDSEDYKSVLAEAQKYAGGLFNGLLMRTHLSTSDLVYVLSKQIKVPGVNLKDIIRRSADILPAKLPAFISFVGANLGSEEISQIERSNEDKHTYITLQEIFLGVYSIDAENYMKKSEEYIRKTSLEIASLRRIRKGYRYLRPLPDDSGDSKSTNNPAMNANVLVDNLAMRHIKCISPTNPSMNHFDNALK